MIDSPVEVIVNHKGEIALFFVKTGSVAVFTVEAAEKIGLALLRVAKSKFYPAGLA